MFFVKFFTFRLFPRRKAAARLVNVEQTESIQNADMEQIS